MCFNPKPAGLPAVPTVKEEPVAPMQSPEASDTTTGALRKARTGRKGLKIDLTSGSGSGGTGLAIPV